MKNLTQLNSNVDLHRPGKVLKEKWGNIKKCAVKSYAKDRKYVSDTGGGPCIVFKTTPIDGSVKEILGLWRLSAQYSK